MYGVVHLARKKIKERRKESRKYNNSNDKNYNN
jgi:hypothetical protein